MVISPIFTGGETERSPEVGLRPHNKSAALWGLELTAPDPHERSHDVGSSPTWQ